MPINGAIWYLTATLSLFLIAAIIIVFSLLFISNLFITILPNCVLINWVKKVGRNSIVFLGLNELVINVIKAQLSKMNMVDNISVVITFLLTCMVIMFIINILQKLSVMGRIFSLS